MSVIYIADRKSRCQHGEGSDQYWVVYWWPYCFITHSTKTKRKSDPVYDGKKSEGSYDVDKWIEQPWDGWLESRLLCERNDGGQCER